MIFLTISPRGDSLNFECNEIRVCRGCLAYEVELHNIHEGQVAQIFSEFSRTTVSKYDGLSQFICNCCLHLVRKFQQYQTKWNQAASIMQQMQLENKLITKEWLNSEELVKLKPNLKYTKTCLVPCGPKHEDSKPTDSIKEELLNTDNNIKEVSKQIDLDDAKIYDNNDDCDDTNIGEVIFHEDLDIVKKYDNNDDCDDTNISEDIFDEETITSELCNHEDLDKAKNNDNNDDCDDTNISEVIFDEESIDSESYNHEYDDIEYLEVSDEDSATQNESHNENEVITAKRSLLTEKSKKGNGKKVKLNLNKNKKQTRPRNQNKMLKIVCKTKKTSMQNMEDFEKEYNVVGRILSEEEQKREIVEMRSVFYKNAPYKCNICYRGFTRSWTLEGHMKVHDPSFGDFVCDICGIRCKSNYHRIKHINLRHLKRFTCKKCGFVTKSAYHARLHFKQHIGETGSRCDHCEKEFAVPSKYLYHLRSHLPSTVRCEVCAKKQPGEAGLAVHMKITHKTAVRCGSCNTLFHSHLCLKTHLEGRDDGVCEPGTKPCPMCGVNFATPELLKTHFLEHNYTKCHCKECPLIFISRHELDKHMKTHGHTSKQDVRIDPIICEVCGKDFKNRYVLQYHQRIHTGERPYKCTMCPKAFRFYIGLKYHMNMHTDTRPYKCEVCSQAFKQPNHLICHTRVHTQERPHTCEICGKRFGLVYNMREHMRTVHAGLPPRRRQRRQGKRADTAT